MGVITSRRAVRLLRHYRGHPPGTVLSVTNELATRLLLGNWAVIAEPGIRPAAAQPYERAVATHSAETR